MICTSAIQIAATADSVARGSNGVARNYAALKHEYLSEMDALTDSEFGRLCRELLRYSIDGTESQMEGNERFYWNRVKRQEDYAKDSYSEKCEKNSENAKKRWQKNKANERNNVRPHANECETCQYENENKNKNNTQATNVAKSKKRQSRFRPPTRESVSAYCVERGNSVDSDSFCDYYESNGWRVGKNPMKDWKAAVRSWERRDNSLERNKNGTAGESADQKWGDLPGVTRL